MYYITHACSDLGRPYYEADLIEAEGEAENLFIDQCEQYGYADRMVVAIDDISQDDIQLDMVDYIGQEKFNRFEKTLENYTEDDGELTLTKINSWYLACLKAKR